MEESSTLGLGSYFWNQKNQEKNVGKREASTRSQSANKVSDTILDIHDKIEMHDIDKEGSTNATIRSLRRRFDEVPPVSSGYSIYRVPERLRSVKEEAYTPMLISIGPFHHGNPKYMNMEYDKIRNLNTLLKRHKAPTLEQYVEELMGLEREARKCYAESFSFSKDDFVKIMLLDGCYIVELFIQYQNPGRRIEDDPIFKNHWIFNAIYCDLLLLENQLPFFVLEKLFTLINGTSGDEASTAFTALTSHFLGHYRVIRNHLPENYLLHDLHNKNLVHLLLYCFTSHQNQSVREDKDETDELVFIPSATELSQVGMKFTKSDIVPHSTEGSRSCKSLLDVRFEDGLLTIPTLVVDHRTESLFRNLIAFEQSHNCSTIVDHKETIDNNSDSSNMVSDYVTLIDCLINTSADVKFLRDRGIIHNHLGDNEEVAQLFNKLRNGIVTRSNEFHFSYIFHDVNAYYGTKWNRLKATLKKDYFNNPWARISFAAAALLLILGVIQTFCSLVQITASKGRL